MDSNENKGKHFNLADRREIEYLLSKGYKYKDIAIRLGRTTNAIRYEVRKNTGTVPRNKCSHKENSNGDINHSNNSNVKYNAEKAHHKACYRRHNASFRSKKILNNSELHKFIDKSLLSFQSPEAIAGRLRSGKENLPYVSRTTIEHYINSPWGEHIRVEINKFKKKYRRKKNHNKKSALDGRVFIDERPLEVQNRQRVGDVEMDFIVSGKGGVGYLLTIRDRRTRKNFIRKLYPVTFENLKSTLLKIKEIFPELKSITTDNDLLLSQHNILSKALAVPIYFCHPYSSWEKGSVENLNKFIRKFIRKGSNIYTYSSEMIQRIEDISNNLYMSVLDYLTPNEAYAQNHTKDLTK